MDKKQHKKLAIDIVERRIFGTWNIRPGDERLVGNIFMPLLFAKKAEVEYLKKQEAHIYEYMEKVCSARSINGYPIFGSCYTLADKDCIQVFKYVRKIQKQRDKLKNGGVFVQLWNRLIRKRNK